MTTISKTTLNLNGVNVPLRINSMKSRKGIHFKQLCPECDTPIKQKRVCPTCNEERGYKELNKGYKLGDEMLSFNRNAIKQIKESVNSGLELVKVEPKSKAVEIERVKGNYFLSADEGGEKMYNALKNSLKNTNLAIEVKYAIRSKQSLYAIWYSGNTNSLMLSKLAYKNDIKQEVETEENSVSEDIVDKTTALMKKLRKKTENKSITDNYREKLEKAIEKKAEGKELEVEQEVEKVEEENLEEQLMGALG